MLTFNNRVIVTNLRKVEAINIWNGYDDLKPLIGEKATITSIIDSTLYGLEFDNLPAQLIRERTGYIFDASEITLLGDGQDEK